MKRIPTTTPTLVVAILVVMHGASWEKPVATVHASSTRPAWTEAPDYPQKVQKLENLFYSAPTSQPSSGDVAELFDQALHDPDFRIRVRAMAVFPYLRDREKATDVLIACVHDRDPETSGNRNVPLYATTYLADMAATRAIPDVADWVNFLKANPDYDKNPNKLLEKKGAEDLRRLTQAAATRPAS